MTDIKTQTKKPWLKILLVISLGLNLAVAGLFIGAKVAGHKYRGGHRADISGLRGFMRALPDNKRGEARKYFKTHRRAAHANGETMRDAIHAIHKVILAQPFDPDALNTAFAKQRSHIATTTQDAQSAFVAIIAGMTDAERAAYVEKMQQQQRKWRKDRERKPKP